MVEVRDSSLLVVRHCLYGSPHIALREQLTQGQWLSGTPTNLDFSLQTDSHFMKFPGLCSLHHIWPANKRAWLYHIALTILIYVSVVCVCSHVCAHMHTDRGQRIMANVVLNHSPLIFQVRSHSELGLSLPPQHGDYKHMLYLDFAWMPRV